MRVSFCKVFFLNYLLLFAKSEEPHCSKYDFEEKVLEKMVRMEFQMERMKSKIEETIKSVDKKLTSMDEKLIEIEAKEAELINTCTFETLQGKLDEKFEALQNKTSENVDAKIKELQILKEQIAIPTVAFKARLDTNIATPVGQIILFPAVLFNEGDAYNSKTGKFTATTNGTYLFTIAFCLMHLKHLYAHIKVDGVTYSVANFYGDANHECLTADAVAVLSSGQSVWVQPSGSASGSIIHQDSVRWNTFSGVLLHR